MCAAEPTTIEFWKILIPTLIPTVIAIISWVVVHFLSKRKDLQNKRKEIISKYLIDAYRNIENCCGRGEGHSLTAAQKAGIEQAIADVQLFGSTSQITLAKNFIESMNASSYGDPRNLLAKFRNDLRRELNLSAASDDSNDIVHWRLL